VRHLISVLAIVGLMLSGAGPTPAQPLADGSGPARLYNPQTVEVLNGQVVKVEKVTPKRKGAQEFKGFMLQTEKENILVFLGPSRFIDKMPYQPAVGDPVSVKGSRVTFRGRPLIIAAEVRKGAQVMQLRDDAGRPLMRRKPR